MYRPLRFMYRYWLEIREKERTKERMKERERERENIDQYSNYPQLCIRVTQYKVYYVSYTHIDVRDSKINTANE